MSVQEEFEGQPSQPFDFGRYIDIARRRHVLFLGLLFVGWLLVWGSSWFLAPRYKSSTLILVEEPTMPKSYVVPNVSDDLQDRLQSITQQILSRTRLLLIINKLHLYEKRNHTYSPDEKVALMTRDIDIELVRDTQNQNITAFRIYYSAPDPHIAQEVTSELTNLFIDENVRVREQESENTTQFIQNQLTSARAALADQDAKVKAFQTTHEGSLPTQEATNLQILSGLQSQLQNEQDALNAAKQQRVYHQAMVDQYKTLREPMHTASGAPTGLAEIDQELDTLKTKLANLSSRYTDQYPEVQQVKAEIAKTEKSREQLVAKLKEDSGTKTANESSTAEEPILTAQNAPLVQLQSQLRADQLEISNREQAIANLKARIGDYQARLNDEPAVAQQLADLTRGYEQSQKNYDDLLQKENDSQMATSMEQMQEGERFTMLDPPSLPLKPDFPNRLKMCEAGLGAGLALGVLVIGLLEFLDGRLHTDGAIEKLLSVPIIVGIPEILNQSDQRRQKRKLILGWTMAAVVLIIIAAGSAFSYLRA